MNKKLTAMLLATSMVISSPIAALAAETDSSAAGKDTQSAAAAEDDVENEGALENASDETADEKIDFHALVAAYLAEIKEAVSNVDLKEKIAVTGREFAESGTVFSLFKDLLTDIGERRKADGSEEDEAVTQALDTISSLSETDENELEDLVDMAVLGIIASEVDEDLDEGTGPEDLEISNAVVNFVIKAAEENKLIAEAVKETGSRLFEMLTNISTKLQDYVEDDGTMSVIEDISELPFEDFEAELAKATDYISQQDGPKHAALDLLDLLHNIVDELHYVLHGHTHEALESEADSQRPETDLEVMLPVHQYELISSAEVNGRQGVCSEGDYYWVSGSTTLSKYDKDWNLIKTNDDPFKGYTLEVNHIADIDVYDNELYIGAEYFMDGVGNNIQIAVYDADTLELKRTFPFEAESGQLECSGIAVDPDTKTVWMCSWVGEESGRYLYKYDLETGKYLGKVHMQMPPQWLQGIAYYDGWFYMTADDGTADDNEPDHLYKTRIADGATNCIVTLERTFDDVTRQGEIEGLTFDKDLHQLLLLYNRGARIVLGMPRGFYDGYDKEISEVFTYQLVD